jgi:hypothetical protein
LGVDSYGTKQQAKKYIDASFHYTSRSTHREHHSSFPRSSETAIPYPSMNSIFRLEHASLRRTSERILDVSPEVEKYFELVPRLTTYKKKDSFSAGLFYRIFASHLNQMHHYHSLHQA